MAKNDYVVESLDLAREQLKKFALTQSGMAYVFVTDNKGVITVHERWSQPCYGEMRPYGKTHPDLLPEHQRAVGKPGDLHSPFPKEGNPVLAMLVLYQKPNTWDKENGRKEALAGLEDILSVYLSQEHSPWRVVTKGAEVLRDDDGIPHGIIFNDTDVDPTVLVESWMWFRGKMNISGMVWWNQLRETLPDVNVTELLAFYFNFYSWTQFKGKINTQLTNSWGSYVLSNLMDPQRWLKGDPIIDGPTFFNRGAYNRPKLDKVFGEGNGAGLTEFKKKFPSYITVEQVPDAFRTFHETVFG